VLAADNVYSWLSDSDNERWREALPALLDDFQQLLRDALDLPLELGETNHHGDRSWLDLPSITYHWQNKKREPRDWVALIELLRDAWLVTREKDPERATMIAQGWYELPYPTFKRLALFAASQDGCIASDQWVDWLIANDARWLWAVGTQRETMRLLVLQGANLSPEAAIRLEAKILEGPPRAMYPGDIEPEDWRWLVDHPVWLRLAKLREGGGRLGGAAAQRFKELSANNPKWTLASHERNEFSSWMSGSGDPDYEDYEANHLYTDIVPRKRRDLVKWLKQPPPARRPFYEDTWSETCRTRFFHSCGALCDLTQEGRWPEGRWREALQVWREEGRVLRSWRFAAPLVQTMPDDVLQEISDGVTWWLEVVSRSIDRHEVILLDLCRRVLALPHEDVRDIAINHPVGEVTQALLNLCFKREPNDNDGLPQDIEPIFTRLCDLEVRKFRPGRALLASQLMALFLVDRRWTETHLLRFSLGRPMRTKRKQYGKASSGLPACFDRC